MLAQVALAAGAMLVLAGCAPGEVTTTTTLDPAPGYYATLSAQDKRFLGELGTYFPEVVATEDTQRASISVGRATCAAMVTGATFEQIADEVYDPQEAAMTTDISTTTMAVGIVVFCPEYADSLTEWQDAQR